MSHKIALIESIRKELENNKMKPIQLLLVKMNERPAIRFASVNSEKLNLKVKALADRYCESLEFAKETPTTLTYYI